MGIRVAVDIGGTFTDLVAVDETSGRVHVHKASSSPTAPIDAVRSVFAKAGLAAGDVSLFVHGTTVATNALIERDGTRIAFVTNRGFRDVLFIQDGTRRDLYSLEWHKPRPLVARYDCLEVGGRIDADGEVVAALDDEDVAAVVAHLRAEGIRSVAIGLVFAQANPDHELELEARLRAEIPDLATSLSHRVFPRWRENDRWQTVVADAYLKAMFARYVRNLEGGLEETGVAARLVLMKSNGGVVEAATAAEQPVNYLVSGPVGGVLGGSHFARQAGFEQIMTIDIGGTSSDVSLVAGGDIPRRRPLPARPRHPDQGADDRHHDDRRRRRLDRLGRRRRPAARRSPQRRFDARAGVLRARRHRAHDRRREPRPRPPRPGHVLRRGDPARRRAWPGPRSTPSRSRSACRSRRPRRRCSSSRPTTWSTRCGSSRSTAASMRATSRSSRSAAPGGLHGAEVARTLGIGTVIVPPYPGNTSAYGLLTAGLRTDLSTTLLVRVDDPSAAGGRRRRARPAARPRRWRRSVARAPPAHRWSSSGSRCATTGRTTTARSPSPDHCRSRTTTCAPRCEAFHADYEVTYGYQQPWEHVEIVGAQVTASSPGEAPGLGALDLTDGAAPARTRPGRLRRRRVPRDADPHARRPAPPATSARARSSSRSRCRPRSCRRARRSPCTSPEACSSPSTERE